MTHEEILAMLGDYVDYLIANSSAEAPMWNIEKVRSGKPNKWNYIDGCMITACLSLYKTTSDEKYLRFSKNFIDWFVQEDGSIKTYDPKEYNLDNVNQGKNLFTLYDIHFINTLDNSEWHPSGLIRVKMPMVSIGDYKTPVIVHIADSGKIRLIEGHVDSAGGTIEFEASDFSLYGIAGSDQSIDSLLGAQAARDVMPWIIAGAIAAAILIAIIVMRKRGNKRGFYE